MPQLQSEISLKIIPGPYLAVKIVFTLVCLMLQLIYPLSTSKTINELMVQLLLTPLIQFMLTVQVNLHMLLGVVHNARSAFRTETSCFSPALWEKNISPSVVVPNLYQVTRHPGGLFAHPCVLFLGTHWIANLN